jgi:hypothetical protein
MGLMSNLINEFFPYSHQQLGFDKPVNIVLMSDGQNAENPLGKTAYYEPSTHTVTLFVDHRHPKDILRSLSHELVHHKQNCAGHFANSGATEEGYAQSDPHLREMEVEAFTSGNMVFRDWCDTSKHLAQKQLFETNYTQQRSVVMKLDEKELREKIKEIVQSKIEEVGFEAFVANLKEELASSETENLEEVDKDDDGSPKKPEWAEKGETPKWADPDDDDPDVKAELEEADIDEERKYTASQRAARRGQPHDTSAGALRTAKEKEEEEELKKTKALAKVREELVEPPLKEWHQNTLYNRLLKEWIKK